jgi:hypothetical protein
MSIHIGIYSGRGGLCGVHPLSLPFCSFGEPPPNTLVLFVTAENFVICSLLAVRNPKRKKKKKKKKTNPKKTSEYSKNSANNTAREEATAPCLLHQHTSYLTSKGKGSKRLHFGWNLFYMPLQDRS